MRTVIVFDFDGTVAVGDGPVLAYATQVGELLGCADEFVSGIRRTLAAGSLADTGALDGYDLVRLEAERRGADADLLGQAFQAGRALLGTPDAAITAPEGLAAFLGAAAGHAERMLVTNAPGIRLDAALRVIGLDGLFDRVVADAGKPTGMAAVLDAVPTGTRVLSVGDIWRNDLAPAHERGHATALIGGTVGAGVTPTFHAASLTELLPQLRAWLDVAAGSADSVQQRPQLGAGGERRQVHAEQP